MIRNRILVAEDNPAQQRLILTLLKKGGYEVLGVNNGYLALEELDQFKPDLILLDNMMPVLGGIETCRQIKANEKWKDTPIIFITALKHDQAILNAFQAGAIDYIIKPYSKDEVFLRVSAQLSHREVVDQKMELIRALQIGHQDRVLGQLSVGLAHNFNNMLTSVMGFCQLIDMTTKEDENKKRIGNVRKVLDDIHKMINNLREFSDRSEVILSEMNLPQFIEKNARFISQSSFPEMIIEISVEGDEDQLRDHFDTDSINTCLYNALQNCHEARRPKQELRVNLNISRVCLPEHLQSKIVPDRRLLEYIRIRITDNGKGFDPSLGKPEEAFQPFCTTKRTVGVGLGLSVVQGIVSRHKGITDASNLAKQSGAILDLYLPVTSA